MGAAAVFRSQLWPLRSRLGHGLRVRVREPVSTMSFSRTATPRMASSGKERGDQEHGVMFRVPEMEAGEMVSTAEKIMERWYGSDSNSEASKKKKKRKGKGTAVVWFRNDLRVLDNEALLEAWTSSDLLLPIYCIDPRIFSTTTHFFGFPKTGPFRAQFLLECLHDLRSNLLKRGLNLLILHGKPEDVLPSIAQRFQAHTVYAQKETCSEELSVERRVLKRLQQVVLSLPQEFTDKTPRLCLIWGSTMCHIDDLPFPTNDLPDMYTQFRKAVESKSRIRECLKIPKYLGPAPCIDDWGCVPTVDQLGLHLDQVTAGIRFYGGENAALSRVDEYFWKKDLLCTYKHTRNGMVGADYSTKFSPWLAAGCLSPRFIYEEVKRYEKERLANDSTYWVLFELIWRDYFRFLSIKYGNSIFHLGGPRKVEKNWSQDQSLFECWKEGQTGYPLIDANMKELLTTGFMSNRGRQIVFSFLVRDMGLDWRMGAEWFESYLLDYDPCSNYGNWTYGAGVGNDPREDRYFSIPKQAQTYDPDGEYVAFWLPQLRQLPKDKRHFPGRSYIQPVVPLKFGNAPRQHVNSTASTARRMRNSEGRQMKGHWGQKK